MTTPGRPSKSGPYAERDADQLILRDMLAIDRTVLANERTLLAYIRTALALLVGGVTLIHFFDLHSARILGYTMLPFGPVALIIGTWRYRRVNAHLRLGSRKGG